MAIKTIERIRTPGRMDFYSKYVLPQQPVILTDLFEGQPIGQLGTLERARTELADVPLAVQGGYGSLTSGATPTPGTVMRFAEYLRFIESDPDANLICTEYDTPARVSAQFRLPDICRASRDELQAPDILGLPRRWGDHDLLSNMFLGNKGNYAHLHYDGDQRQVFLHQVFGRKRVVLFPPSAGAELDVANSFCPGHSNIYLERKSAGEKLEFIDAVGGYDGIMEPGDTVYIPMLFWHYLEYTDTGMSVNYRFGRNSLGRFFCVDNFHRDYYVQNVASKMGDAPSASVQYGGAIETTKNALLSLGGSRTDNIRRMRGLFKELCAKIAPEAAPERYCTPEHDEIEIAKISEDIEFSGVYRGVVASNVPAGPITPSQGSAIRSRARQLGHSQTTLDKVIYNRFAKESVGALTRTEAAVLIRSFSSPGAAWA